MSDWLLNLPVLWMAVVVFAATYLLCRQYLLEPYHLTGAIHLAADKPIGCSDYRSLWRRSAEEAVMAHKFDAITRRERLVVHLMPPF